MRARVAANIAIRARQKQQSAAAVKKKGMRGMNAQALIETHRELLESLTPAQYEKLNGAFLAFGRTTPGFITAKELGPLLRSLGDAPKPAELKDLIAMVDADGNALIDFQEFLVLVAVRSQHHHIEDEVLEAFRLFDPEGTGTVRVSTFRAAMAHLTGMTDAELDDMIAEARAISRQEEARRLEQQEARAARREARRAARRELVEAKPMDIITPDSLAAPSTPPAPIDYHAPAGRSPPAAPDIVADMFAKAGAHAIPAAADFQLATDSSVSGALPRSEHATVTVLVSSPDVTARGPLLPAPTSAPDAAQDDIEAGHRRAATTPAGIEGEPAETEELIYYEQFVMLMFSY